MHPARQRDRLSNLFFSQLTARVCFQHRIASIKFGALYHNGILELKRRRHAHEQAPQKTDGRNNDSRENIRAQKSIR